MWHPNDRSHTRSTATHSRQLEVTDAAVRTTGATLESGPKASMQIATMASVIWSSLQPSWRKQRQRAVHRQGAERRCIEHASQLFVLSCAAFSSVPPTIMAISLAHMHEREALCAWRSFRSRFRERLCPRLVLSVRPPDLTVHVHNIAVTSELAAFTRSSLRYVERCLRACIRSYTSNTPIKINAAWWAVEQCESLGLYATHLHVYSIVSAPQSTGARRESAVTCPCTLHRNRARTYQ